MVEAFVEAGTITVSVTDRGRWQRDSLASARSFNRGRGLTLMHKISDRVDVVRNPRGTQVTLTFALRPARTVA